MNCSNHFDLIVTYLEKNLLRKKLADFLLKFT